MFSMNINGVLEVTAEEKSSAQEVKLNISKGEMDQNLVEELVLKGQEMEEDDKKYLERIKFRNEIQQM